jgi:hypothetical protein
MDIEHPKIGNLRGEPAPIPFFIAWPDHVLDGTIAIGPSVGNSPFVELEVHLAGKHLGSAALTEESALDLALRLVGTIMDRRKAAEAARTLPRSASAPYCSPFLEGSPAVAEPSNNTDQGLRSGVQPNRCSQSTIRSK